MKMIREGNKLMKRMPLRQCHGVLLLSCAPDPWLCVAPSRGLHIPFSCREHLLAVSGASWTLAVWSALPMRTQRIQYRPSGVPSLGCILLKWGQAVAFTRNETGGTKTEKNENLILLCCKLYIVTPPQEEEGPLPPVPLRARVQLWKMTLTPQPRDPPTPPPRTCTSGSRTPIRVKKNTSIWIFHQIRNQNCQNCVINS